MAIIDAAADGSICINVRVIARARRTELAGTREDALVVRVNAPPVDDAANEELVSFIASLLGVSRTAITILSGRRSRHKRLRIAHIDVAAAEACLRRHDR
jgi:uncharacterized protein (TIGR00251 family)